MSVVATATHAYWAQLAQSLSVRLQADDVALAVGTGGWNAASLTPVSIAPDQAQLNQRVKTLPLYSVTMPNAYTVRATARLAMGDVTQSVSEAALIVAGELWFVRNYEPVPAQDLDWFDVSINICFKPEGD